ncbi:peptidoglycan-binding domain-containing protein [uncultured Methanobacterium sp.]|uniref:peptidoglycan-binding domain-containing protein n=1 Tax=uncultured Methanobacterium sp. TaxID=176306 RepID=UPI002AA74B07|nr:peptidoglycan-binding domain-containing protein [uncultured Methanobacterium sp.]
MIVMCALFVAIPAVGAAESTDSGSTIMTNASTDQNLTLGMTGDNVTQVQKWLKNQGFYTGAIDGEFGNYTEQAVKDFQGYVGIKQDGIVGNISLHYMKALSTGKLKIGDKSDYSHSTNSETNYNSNKTVYNGNKSHSSSSNSLSRSSSGSSSSSSSSVSSSSGSSSSSSSSVSSSSSYSTGYTSGTDGWSSGKGTGDCWENSNILYNQLISEGYTARIIQYSNSYSANHRSVEIWDGSSWVDYDYKGNGYSNRYYATSHDDSSVTVIASNA